MQNMIMIGRYILLIMVFFLNAACVSNDTFRPTGEDQQRLLHAISEFKKVDELKPLFEQSVAYAVYPTMFRASSGFGGAFGSGWIVKDDVTYRASDTWQFSAGISAGFQLYRQIIFFRTPEALQYFEEGSFEFASQANLAFITWGTAGDPAFNPETALFTQVRGGLLVEATVGMHHYIQSKPLKPPPE